VFMAAGGRDLPRVPVLNCPSRGDFWGPSGVFNSQKPAVLRGLPVGECLSVWDSDYFCRDKRFSESASLFSEKLSVHVSDERYMSSGNLKKTFATS